MLWSGATSAPDTHRVAAAIWRIESPKLIAVLARLLQNVPLAEELAQDAFVEALQSWGQNGMPDNPGGWLMTAARHRALDALRHTRRAARKHEQIERELETALPASFDEALDDIVGDDLLRLMFVACHPALSQEARVALTLRLLGGLTTDEIARGFLVAEPTIAQRITRAKRTLGDLGVPFELPRPSDLRARLASVLEVIYLVFNEGYLASAGDDWMRPALCEDALRLGRTLAELSPAESEVHALVSLMEIQSSRARARSGPNGEAVLLLEQDRSQWDTLLVRRGLDGLARAEGLARAGAGPYLLQAAIAACHALAPTSAETDWDAVISWYDVLLTVHDTPVVRLNRAAAIAERHGPAAGLAAVDAVDGLDAYAFWHASRGELLARLDRWDEADAAWRGAIDLGLPAANAAYIARRRAERP